MQEGLSITNVYGGIWVKKLLFGLGSGALCVCVMRAKILPPDDFLSQSWH